MTAFFGVVSVLLPISCQKSRDRFIAEETCTRYTDELAASSNQFEALVSDNDFLVLGVRILQVAVQF